MQLNLYLLVNIIQKCIVLAQNSFLCLLKSGPKCANLSFSKTASLVLSRDATLTCKSDVGVYWFHKKEDGNITGSQIISVSSPFFICVGGDLIVHRL